MENSRYTNIHIIGVPEEEREICVENVVWLNCGLKMSESEEGNRYLGMRGTVSSLKFMNSDPFQDIIKTAKFRIL